MPHHLTHLPFLRIFKFYYLKKKSIKLEQYQLLPPCYILDPQVLFFLYIIACRFLPPPPHFSYLQPLVTMILLFFSESGLCRISHKIKSIIYVFLHLAYSIKCQALLLYKGWIVFHCIPIDIFTSVCLSVTMYVSQIFIFPFIHLGALRMFPYLGYRK